MEPTDPKIAINPLKPEVPNPEPIPGDPIPRPPIIPIPGWEPPTRPIPDLPGDEQFPDDPTN